MKYLTRQNDLPNVYASLSKCAQMCMIELVKDRMKGKKWKKTEMESESERERMNDTMNKRGEWSKGRIGW